MDGTAGSLERALGVRHSQRRSRRPSRARLASHDAGRDKKRCRAVRARVGVTRAGRLRHVERSLVRGRNGRDQCPSEGDVDLVAGFDVLEILLILDLPGHDTPVIGGDGHRWHGGINGLHRNGHFFLSRDGSAGQRARPTLGGRIEAGAAALLARFDHLEHNGLVIGEIHLLPHLQFVEPLNLLADAEGVLVAVVVAQRARVGVERRVRVADHLLVQPGDPVEQLDPRERIVVVRDHHLEDVDELRVLAAGLVDRLEDARGHDRLDLAVHEPVEGVQRLGVRRIHLERLAVALDRARHVTEAELPVLADAVLERDRLALVVGELDLALASAYALPRFLESETYRRLAGSR